MAACACPACARWKPIVSCITWFPQWSANCAGQNADGSVGAGFPGGPVTGASESVGAMEIIAELEPTVRWPYCGCLGYIGFDGTMDTNILIRTFTGRSGLAAISGWGWNRCRFRSAARI